MSCSIVNGAIYLFCLPSYCDIGYSYYVNSPLILGSPLPPNVLVRLTVVVEQCINPPMPPCMDPLLT